MVISISGKHVSVTDEMKQYAEKKIRSIIEEKHKINKTIIVLEVEKNRHIAEFIIHGKNINFEADYESFDMYESIDVAVTKIERQLEKYFDKKQDHHKTGKHNKLKIVSDETENDDLDVEVEIELELEES
jgi:putative sigma-54 modulation protein